MTIKYTVAICVLLSSWIYFSYATQDKKLEVTHKVFFAIEIGGEKAGYIEIGLFGKIVPKTVQNFVQLAQNPKGDGYNGSKFHRIIPKFAILGGDYINGDGTGGRSTYGVQFEAENFKLKHYGPGWLSMRTTCKRTMNSQFFITLSKLTSLDGRNVVFGKVLEGMDVVRKIENTDINSQYRPIKDVIITESGAEAILDPFEIIEEATEVNEFESIQSENKF